MKKFKSIVTILLLLLLLISNLISCGEKCETCHGEKKVTCTSCNGRGEYLYKCDECHGEGRFIIINKIIGREFVEDCKACVDGFVRPKENEYGYGMDCPLCDGSGKKECYECMSD